MRRARHIRLSGPDPTIARRVLTGPVQLAEDGTSWVTITRTGSFTDPRYGRFEITLAMLESMVRNFEAKVLGVDVFIDVDHRPGDGAAARILALKVEGQRLRAQVEWTDFGRKAIQERGFRYLSAEYHEQWRDNEGGKDHGPTLLGAGLTVRPVIKRLDPVTLAEDSKSPVLLHPELLRQLTHDLKESHMKRLEQLRKKLAAAGLSEAVIEKILASYTTAAKTLAESDDAGHDALLASFEAAVTTLSEQRANAGPVNLTVGLTADDVKKLLAEAQTAQATEAKRLADATAANVKLFTDALGEAKGLSEETRKELAKGVELVTANLSPEQVKQLAAQYLAFGERIEAGRKLAALGHPAPGGVVHLSQDDTGEIRKLAESIRGRVRATAAGDTMRLPADEAKLPKFAQRVLAEFDRTHAQRLHDEHKALSGGVVNIGDTSLPASYTREVIVEALSDLRILEMIDADVDPTNAATHSVPYETRSTASVYNEGVVYEGQPIHQAGISQATELQYIVPMKIALEVTDEAMFFTRNNQLINWDAWGRNVASNARLACELIARRIMNMLQRSADAYGAVTRTAEAYDSQLTGSNSVIKTTYFPIVRPHTKRDLQGNAIGSTENPITVVLNGTTLSEYDGTGTQSSGTYWRVTNYNLGYIQLVNQSGVAQTPSDSGTNTVTYSSASNVVKVDLDVASGSTYERQMNKILQAVGARKAYLAQDQFVKADFMLMSETLHNSATDAENFAANYRRDGTNTTPMGDLAEIKGIPGWATNVDADLGEERILLGQRGTLKYRVAKPFSIGAPFELFNSAGKALGKKGAYGIEYSSISVPTPLRPRVTSVLAYSVTGR